MSIPNDVNIVSKRIEKIEKYANLSIELKELWSMKTVERIPVAIGCTGPVDKKFIDDVEKFLVQLRLLFVLATEHTLLHILFNIWRQIWLPGDLHDAAFKNFCTTEFGTFNSPRGMQLPARLSNCQCIFI